MRRRWLITSFVVAMLLVAIVWAIKWERTVPLGQCSRLYQEYADRADVNVSFIKDFYINDSIAVDVTLMQPTTDSAWSALEDELHFEKKNYTNTGEDITHNILISWVLKSDITKYAPMGPPDYDKSFLRVIYYNKKVVSYFELDNMHELDEVCGYVLKQLKTNIK